MSALVFSALSICNGLPLTTAPSFHDNFNVTVKVQSWIDNSPLTCVVTYCRGDHGLYNFLFLDCTSNDSKYTKLFDFYNDLLWVKKGNTARWLRLKGIPEQEKFDLHFPVEFHTEGRHKVFNKPDSLIRFTKNKKPTQSSPLALNDWQSDSNVNVQGRTYKCTTNVIFTKDSDMDHQCSGKGPARDFCHLVPNHAVVSCGASNLIHYSFFDYRDKFDISIFELPVVTETSHNETADGDLSIRGSTSSVLAWDLLVELVLAVVTAVVMAGA